MGGSLLRAEATGYGCVYFAAKMLHTVEHTLAGKVCVVSGSGHIAQLQCEKIIARGGPRVTLSHSDGCIHDPQGITQEKLDWVKELKNVRRGRIRAYAEHFGCTR